MDAIRLKLEEIFADQNLTPYEMDFVYDQIRRMTEADWRLLRYVQERPGRWFGSSIQEKQKGMTPSDPTFALNAWALLETCQDWAKDNYQPALKKWEVPWVEPC